MSINLNDIIDINITASGASVVRKGFNLGLIIGKSTVISTADRVKIYGGLEEMAAAGFKPTDPEYKDATIYFSQDPKPTAVAIGVQATTGETPLQALTACREKSPDWYAFAFVALIDEPLVQSDIEGIAAYVDACSVKTVWFNELATTGSYLAILTALKASSYKRTLSLVSTGTAGTNSAVGLMGVAMGRNYENAPAFMLAYKSIIGVTPEPATTQSLNDILAQNGNVYVNQGTYYNVLRQGVMANGVPFDELLGSDMLVEGMKAAIMSVLTTEDKVPQTESGVSTFKAALAEPIEKARASEFIVPGVWNADPVRTLKRGDMLASGYVIISDSIASQSQPDRAARKAPPIFALCKLGGAIEHLAVQINVNR